MADNSNETQNPLDPKYKHLYHLHPYICHARSFSPMGVTIQRGRTNPINKDLFDFKTDIKGYVSENIDEICEELSTRWLVALTDTYCDLSDDIGERLAALNITTLVRIIQSSTANMYQSGAFGDIKASKSHKIKLLNKYNNKFFMWDGCHCIPGTDLIYINLIKRTLKCTKNYIEIDKIYKKIIKVLVQEKTSFLFQGNQKLRSKIEKLVT